ncbi:MAG: hypothetical protein WD270_05685 [Acetobacterales bacterium]
MVEREKSRTEARQGRTTGVNRWILAISTLLAVVALLWVFGVISP